MVLSAPREPGRTEPLNCAKAVRNGEAVMYDWNFDTVETAVNDNNGQITAAQGTANAARPW